MGIAAVDPGVIPYGSILYLPEFKRYFFASDTGSAMKKGNGRNIDLLVSTVAEALEVWQAEYDGRVDRPVNGLMRSSIRAYPGSQIIDARSVFG